MNSRVLLCFIGLMCLLIGSILDNVRGPLLPVLSQEFMIGYDKVSYILVLGNIGALICTFSLMPLLNAMTLKKVTSIIFAFVTTVLIFSLFTTNYSTLLFFGLGLGISVSLLGAISNFYVQRSTPPEKRARFMSLLNVMYGAGSMIAPLLFTFIINTMNWTWRASFLIVLPMLVGVYALVLENKGLKGDIVHEDNRQKMRIGLTESLFVAAMCLYVCGEVLTSMWMSAYLQEVTKLSAQAAAEYLSLFFVFIAATRLLCFFFLPHTWNARLLFISLFVALYSFAAGVYFRIPMLLACTGLVGPVYPLFMSEVSEKFPKQWRSVMIWMLSMTQMSLSLSHYAMGFLSRNLGMKLSYHMPYMLILVSILLVSAAYFRLNKQASP